MRQILLLAMALLCGAVQASDFKCLPRTLSTQVAASTSASVLLGSPAVQVETILAEAEGWWCLVPNTADTPVGKINYAPHYRWALKKHRSHTDLSGAFRRIMAAPDLLEAVNGEMRAASIAVAPGSQDEYEVRRAVYAACTALATPPYLVPIDPLPANWCGTVPTPPAPTTATWLTPNSIGLKVYNRAAGDKLGSAIAGRTAPPNNSCNPNAPKVTLGTSTYYPLSGGPLNELVLCRLVQ